MIKWLGLKEMVKEVCVFEIGGGADKEKWIVRCFDFGQLGDAIADTKPTESELKEFFGNPDLLIRYEYDIVSSKFIGLMKTDEMQERLANWTPNIDLIISALSAR